jgi:hypothetical protein
MSRLNHDKTALVSEEPISPTVAAYIAELEQRIIGLRCDMDDLRLFYELLRAEDELLAALPDDDRKQRKCWQDEIWQRAEHNARVGRT